MSTVLILADHQVASTQRLVKAFSGKTIDILLCAPEASLVTQLSHITGIRQIYVANDDAFYGRVAEHETTTALSIAASYAFIAAPASTAGKNVLPRLGAFLQRQPLSDVIEIIDDNTFVRPIYAGALRQTVRTTQTQILLTVRPAAFDPAPLHDTAASVVTIPAVLSQTSAARVLQVAQPAVGRPDLNTARIVVSGGRGFGSAENFCQIEPLADALGAAIGATRAAVDAGYIGSAHQVGQTGKIVAPALYIALGLSGAVQHKAGMKDSGTVVAINTDPQAPIMSDADFSWQTDLFTAIPQIITALKQKDSAS